MRLHAQACGILISINDDRIVCASGRVEYVCSTYKNLLMMITTTTTNRRSIGDGFFYLLSTLLNFMGGEILMHRSTLE